MPRPQRIEYENALYHVMNRGRGRQAIFRDECNYQDFLKTLSEAHERFGLEIHAYCLMGNHYHLLIKTPRANLSRGMRHINGLYTQRFNRHAKTDGPLFRGRFKAVLVQEDGYLLQLTRYIHRNPIEVRRPLVERLEDYPWSSYPAYLNRAPAPDWLNREQSYRLLGHRGRYSQYRSYVERGVDEEVGTFYGKAHWSPVLGDDGFKREVSGKDWKNVSRETLRGQLYGPVPPERILKAVGDVFAFKKDEILSNRRGQRNEARQAAMWLCQRLGGMSHAEIARLFRLSGSSGVSHALRQLTRIRAADADLAERLQLVIQYLTP